MWLSSIAKQAPCSIMADAETQKGDGFAIEPKHTTRLLHTCLQCRRGSSLSVSESVVGPVEKKWSRNGADNGTLGKLSYYRYISELISGWTTPIQDIVLQVSHLSK